MIMSKLDTSTLSSEDPRTRTIVADHERYPDAVRFTGANVHHQGFVFECDVICRRRGNCSGECLAAQFLKLFPENDIWKAGLRRDRGRDCREYYEE